VYNDLTKRCARYMEKGLLIDILTVLDHIVCLLMSIKSGKYVMTQGKMVTCRQCNKKIIDREDINIVAFLFVKPTSFCNDCYSKRERGILRHFLYYPKEFPINSRLFIIVKVILTITFMLVIINMINSALPVRRKIIVISVSGIVIAWQWFLYLYSHKIISTMRKKSKK